MKRGICRQRFAANKKGHGVVSQARLDGFILTSVGPVGWALKIFEELGFWLFDCRPAGHWNWSANGEDFNRAVLLHCLTTKTRFSSDLMTKSGFSSGLTTKSGFYSDLTTKSRFSSGLTTKSGLFESEPDDQRKVVRFLTGLWQPSVATGVWLDGGGGREKKKEKASRKHV